MIYSFVLDDSSSSQRFTTRTEQLTMCCELQQKLRVRLWPCKTSLSSPVILCDTSDVDLVVLCLGVDCLCCVRLMCVFIF